MISDYQIRENGFIKELVRLGRRTLTPEQIDGYRELRIVSRYQEFRGPTTTEYFITSSFVNEKGELKRLMDDRPLTVEHGEEVPVGPLKRCVDELSKKLVAELGKENVTLEGNVIIVRNIWAGLAEKVGYS